MSDTLNLLFKVRYLLYKRRTRRSEIFQQKENQRFEYPYLRIDIKFQDVEVVNTFSIVCIYSSVCDIWNLVKLNLLRFRVIFDLFS